MGTELSTQPKAKEGIATYLGKEAIRKNISGIIGDANYNGFVSDIVSCVQTNPALAECTNTSILNGALTAKAINLPLNSSMGYAYLVPYNNKKKITDKDGKKHEEWVKEAQFTMGYKGFVQLAVRSGKYKKIIATDVRKGEILEYDPFNNEYKKSAIEFEKRNAKDSKGNWLVPIVGYYAMFELVDGFKTELYISKEDMEVHANRYSKAYRSDKEKGWDNSFWTSDFDDMAKKTMIRQLLSKWGLLTPELQKAYVSDMAVINDDGTPEYVDNQPDDARDVKDPSQKYVYKEAEEPIDAEYREIDEAPMPEAFK